LIHDDKAKRTSLISFVGIDDQVNLDAWQKLLPIGNPVGKSFEGKWIGK
jgi:hypothetical protein